jgi:hypothetical protein
MRRINIVFQNGRWYLVAQHPFPAPGATAISQRSAFRRGCVDLEPRQAVLPEDPDVLRLI